MRSKVFGVAIISLMLFATGCTNGPSRAPIMKPPLNPMMVSQDLSKAERLLRETSGIVTTASAFNGERTVKFRVMVNGRPSHRDAVRLFNEVLQVIQYESNAKDMWSYYNARLDIKSYQYGVIYTATKSAGSVTKVSTSVAKGDLTSQSQ